MVVWIEVIKEPAKPISNVIESIIVEGACPAITQECAYLISDGYAYDFVVARLPDHQLRLADFPGSIFGICQVKFKVLEQR